MTIRAGARGVVRKLQGERRLERGGGRRASDLEPNRGWRTVLLIALPIALADWMVKWFVVETVPIRGFRPLWGDHVAIWHVKNPALVLGLHGDLPLVLRQVFVSIYALLAVVFLIAVLGRGHRLLPHRRKWAWLFLGMVLGGMGGNLGERLFHWGITDFLSFRWGDLWLPPGNLADLSILLALPFAFAILGFEMEARGRRAHLTSDGAAPSNAIDGESTPSLDG